MRYFLVNISTLFTGNEKRRLKICDKKCVAKLMYIWNISSVSVSFKKKTNVPEADFVSVIKQGTNPIQQVPFIT
jgi:hypothetical protein